MKMYSFLHHWFSALPMTCTVLLLRERWDDFLFRYLIRRRSLKSSSLLHLNKFHQFLCLIEFCDKRLNKNANKKICTALSVTAYQCKGLKNQSRNEVKETNPMTSGYGNLVSKLTTEFHQLDLKSVWPKHSSATWKKSLPNKNKDSTCNIKKKYHACRIQSKI